MIHQRGGSLSLSLLALTRDGWLLLGTCGLRNFAYGFLSIILGLFLADMGLSAAAIGVLFALALGGGAAMTLSLTMVADRLGRRRTLLCGAALMALAGAAYASSDQVVVLAVAAIVGTISPSGKEVGPFLSVEQAILPQTTEDRFRTHTFAVYNLVGTFAGAIGALAAGLPSLLGMPALEGYRLLVWLYAGTAVVLGLLTTRLSPAVEARGPTSRGTRVGVHRSRAITAKLAVLFGVDAFAGGFIVQGLVALWFYLRFGADIATLSAVFFGANLLSALSFLAAPALARRIGLLNTMVFTHLPSNVLLVLVPLAPTFELAVALFLTRNLLSQMDVPTRQSYTMAIVDPEERAAVAGMLSVARSAAAAVAPLFAGAALATPALGAPFLVAGGLKVAYDLAIFAVFRHVRPPEERAVS